MKGEQLEPEKHFNMHFVATEKSVTSILFDDILHIFYKNLSVVILAQV